MRILPETEPPRTTKRRYPASQLPALLTDLIAAIGTGLVVLPRRHGGRDDRAVELDVPPHMVSVSGKAEGGILHLRKSADFDETLHGIRAALDRYAGPHTPPPPLPPPWVPTFKRGDVVRVSPAPFKRSDGSVYQEESFLLTVVADGAATCEPDGSPLSRWSKPAILVRTEHGPELGAPRTFAAGAIVRNGGTIELATPEEAAHNERLFARRVRDRARRERRRAAS